MSLQRILAAAVALIAVPALASAQGQFQSEVFSTPEPATLVLVASGVVALIAVRRRRPPR
jgi:hypothetical protein